MVKRILSSKKHLLQQADFHSIFSSVLEKNLNLMLK